MKHICIFSIRAASWFGEFRGDGIGNGLEKDENIYKYNIYKVGDEIKYLK